MVATLACMTSTVIFYFVGGAVYRQLWSMMDSSTAKLFEAVRPVGRWSVGGRADAHACRPLGSRPYHSVPRIFAGA